MAAVLSFQRWLTLLKDLPRWKEELNVAITKKLFFEIGKRSNEEYLVVL